MVAVTTPSIRFAKKNQAGEVIDSSEEFSAVSADNNTPPRVVFNKRTSDQDEPHEWGALISGKDGEVFEVQVKDTAAFTTDAPDGTTTYIGIMKHFRQNGKIVHRATGLVIGDRITRSTASTLNDPRGLNDGLATIANEWSPYLRFAPKSGESWNTYGYMLIPLHNNV